ncbi:HpcH/HpaI aldolase/citrate lyase family protein [Nakamurella deserti]|uniref:HpcH/HpaI aldolase/citrate lyase family protein n=1 Tax=Nakamurella deserti TaxID=2164074 RepID=UPI00197B6092|nr:HpcH/HpaI aldolase/citrate lyase family protein [Nakamurella deserti]
MRHFDQLPPDVRAQLFAREPEEFGLDTDIPLLSRALGATLYVPGTRPDLSAAVRKAIAGGVRSMVIDLEDAVEDGRVGDALRQARESLAELSSTGVDALIFVRVRSADHIVDITSSGTAAELSALAGFVLPKFSPGTGGKHLEAVRESGRLLGRRILGMPVIETPEVIFRESRIESLTQIRAILREYREEVLAVRFGATDLCGLYGIRRDRDLSIYDVRVVADLISDAVNQLGREGAENFTISGPVWEYFSNHERMFRPQLRATPFVESDETQLRHRLITKDFDDLIREVVLDRANGLHGKTVIHPSHAAPVHALSVVSSEEFSDASDILASGTGVRASEYRDKMNEARPHRFWAEQIMLRARAFGVAGPDTNFVDFLAALVRT